ncbi:uncharacterized protein LOC141656438 [Silene latifolia]|uniref:uncharacterized protein LOC141656438 n=1 Tax=Silene latifolia TaxID=37657 RepID=UPI003D77C5E2
MDPALKGAAKKGDINFLKEAVLVKPKEYLLSRAPMSADKELGGNILHIAAWHDQVEFFKAAAQVIPVDVQKQLLSQTDDEYRWIPLQAAIVSSVSHSIVKLIKQMYASFDDAAVMKPWLVLTKKNMTPLHLSLENEKTKNEECAKELLLMDSEFVSCTIIDENGNTPLCYALKNRFSDVAEMILTSPLSSASIFSSNDVLEPFTYANNCSENVMRLLFKRYGDWLEKTDSKGHTMLHRWAEKGEAWPCKLLLKEGGDVGDARTKVFKECIFKKEKEMSDTPLHMAGRKKDSELGQILVKGYQEYVNARAEGEIQELVEVERAPWRTQNRYGNTPLQSATHFLSKHEDFILDILLIDPMSSKIINRHGESLFFLAVKYGCARVVNQILRIEEPRFHMLRCNDGATVLHKLSSCPEETGRMLLEKYWWIINLRDNKGNTALDSARQANAPWLVNLLSNPYALQKQHFDWIEACEREESLAVLAFVENCQDLQRECRGLNDTPLHHIKLPTYKDYLNFLKIPSIAELKNTTDRDGATALHRALERKDMLLVKTLLLDDGVERTIADHNGATAMNLLAKLCKENDDWEKMCKLIKVNPYLRTSYIQSGTNLDQIRNTLSVVAALLATITFAAGFTLPGGVNSGGEAILAKKTSFIIFLLADAYGMCTSMFVLFCLIWSMVSVPDVARMLIDRSVFVLVQSLYATLIAFMSGIYTVIKYSSLWAAILIFVMCSIIGVSANRTIFKHLTAKLVPSARREKKDPLMLLEEGSLLQLQENNTKEQAFPTRDTDVM